MKHRRRNSLDTVTPPPQPEPLSPTQIVIRGNLALTALIGLINAAYHDPIDAITSTALTMCKVGALEATGYFVYQHATRENMNQLLSYFHSKDSSSEEEPKIRRWKRRDSF